jgi:hypothetical protein
MYQDKLSAAQTLLEGHNSALGTDSPGRIDIPKFIETIKAAGGSTEERLSGFSHEDILECLTVSIVDLKKFPVQPRVLAKEIAKVFRGKDDTLLVENLGQGITAVTPAKAKKASEMSPRELVERFDPTEPQSKISERLRSMSRGQKFIVFLSGNTIDIDTTTKLLQEVKQGYTGREDIEVGGKIKKVYSIGQLPDNYADENPLYPNRPLRPDGTCDQTGRSWEGVPLAVRQLVYVAITDNEFSVTGHPVGIQNAHFMLDLALAVDAETNLRKRFRKSALKFDELSKTGQLPVLKIALSDEVGEGNTSPFGDGKKVVWAYRARMWR